MLKKILIIDDDADFTEAVSRVLQAKKYKTISASGGRQGFIKAQEEGVSLILLDVMMTYKTEGFNIARQLKQSSVTKDIPIVLVTGIRKELNLPFGFEEDDEFLPVETVLEKPLKPKLLLQIVEKLFKKTE